MEAKGVIAVRVCRRTAWVLSLFITTIASAQDIGYGDDTLASVASVSQAAAVGASKPADRFGTFQFDTGLDTSRVSMAQGVASAPNAAASVVSSDAAVSAESAAATPPTGIQAAPAEFEALGVPSPAASPQAVLQLGPGDAVTVRVFGRPEFDTTSYVGEDQNLNVPLAGPVRVGGLSPSAAANKIAAALKQGEYLVDPQVSVTLEQFRSQQVSVLGEVRTPGRFALESKTSVLDMLALAGGVNEIGADVIYLMRRSADGQMQNQAIDLKKLVGGNASQFSVSLQGGDSIYVPRAEQFYVYGEVQAPNMYRLEPGTTVVQAIARSGGLTPRGSDSRIEIRRKNSKGQYREFAASLGDTVEPNDVIRVKERIF